MISSFDQKPASGGRPARANVAITNVAKVIGIFRHSPPMSFFMSKEWWEAEWLTEPAPRNRQALKKAWVKMWKTAGSHAPTPRPIIM